MNHAISQLERKYPSLAIQSKEYKAVNRANGEVKKVFLTSKLPGNNDITISLRDEFDVEMFDRFLDAEPYLLKHIVGLVVEGEIHVLLVPISPSSIPMDWRKKENPSVQIGMVYNKSRATITIAPQGDDGPLPFIISRARNRFYKSRRPLVAVIKGLASSGKNSIEADIGNVLTSILFDLKFTYGLTLEIASYETFNVPENHQARNRSDIPDTSVEMIYKPYISTLLEFLHAADKTYNLPFRYICYYNTLEYFFNRSSRQFISQILKMMVFRPDFQHRMDFYIDKAVQAFNLENDRYKSETTRLNRILRQYITFDEIEELVKTLSLKEHFTSECAFEGAVPLTLPTLDFTNETLLYKSLAERIHSMMSSICCITMDGTTCTPFTPTAGNQVLLGKEVALIKEIAVTICYTSFT